MLKYYICFIILLFISSINLHGQDMIIKGKITSTGQPIENINIRLSDEKQSTKTDILGDFMMKVAKKTKYTITLTGVGYESKKITLSANKDTLIIREEMHALVSELNEVIVTGVNRATALRKNPVPIAVLSQATMNQNVNTNLVDAIVKGVPGITAVTTGPNVSKPFIRGLGYNRVLTLYDGLRQEGQQWGDEHGIEVDEYGVTRAEVVKGPASLTYGSDALAGVINMIPYLPKQPNGLKGDWTTNYQTNNGMVGSSLGLSLVENDWRYTFRASGKKAHNYYNKIDGYVYGTAFKEYNLSGSARIDKKWGYSKTAITYYNNLMEIPDGSRDSLSRAFTKQVLDDGDDIKNRPLVNQNDLTTYQINPLHQHIQHFRFYNNSQFKIGDGDLNLLLGGQQSIRREYNHPTVPSQAGLYVVLNTLNYDLKYNFPDFGGFESTVGVNGMYQTNRSKAATDFPIPDFNLFDLGAFYYIRKTAGKVDISGGIRIDRRNINWNNFYTGTDGQTGFGKKVDATTSDAYLQFPDFNKNYYGFSGSLGITYNISEKLLLKANIARGYRAPNITEIGSNGLDPGAHIVYLGNRTFKPEFNLQEDIGFIAYLKDADISLEIFNNNIQNYIYQSRLTDADGNPVVIVPGNLTYQYQQAKARLYGGELSINLHPSTCKWLNFNNSLAYVVGLNQNKTLIQLHGNDARYLPFIPPLQIRSELKLTAPKGTGLFEKPYFKVDALFSASQDKFYALDDTETFTSAYTLFNAGIGSSLKSKSGKHLADIFIQVDNIFNIAYQSHLNRLKYFEYYEASPNGRSGIYNMGRNISFKMIVPF